MTRISVDSPTSTKIHHRRQLESSIGEGDSPSPGTGPSKGVSPSVGSGRSRSAAHASPASVPARPAAARAVAPSA